MTEETGRAKDPKNKLSASKDAYNRGLDLYDGGDWAAAVESLKEALTQASESNSDEGRYIAARAAMKLGDISYELGDTDSAVEHWREAASANETTDSLLTKETASAAAYNLGVLLNMAERTSEAIEAWTSGVSLGSSSETSDGLKWAAQSAFNLGYVLLGGDRSDEAIDWWQRAVGLGEAAETAEGREISARAAFNMGETLHQAGQTDDANSAWEKSLSLGRTSGTKQGQEFAAQAAYKLGLRLTESKRDGKAILYFGEAADLGEAGGTDASVEVASQASLALGLGLIKISVNEACSAWSKAISLAEAHQTELGKEIIVEAATNLGRHMVEQGNIEQGIEVLQKAVSSGQTTEIPESKGIAGQAAFLLGLALQQLGKTDEAIEAFENAAALGEASGTKEGAQIRESALATMEQLSLKPVEATSVQKKGIVLVHGMGHQAKDAMLLKVTNSVADWLQKNVSYEGGEKSPSLELDLHKDTPSRITLKHGRQDWVFTEAYWAPVINSPLFDPMVGWTFNRFLFHLAVLTRTAVTRSVIPTSRAILLVALLTVFAAAVFPFLVLIFPLLGLMDRLTVAMLNILYVRFLGRAPPSEDPDTETQGIKVASARWRRWSPWLIGLLLGIVCGAPILIVWLMNVGLAAWLYGLLVYLGLMVSLSGAGWAVHKSGHLEVGGAPLPVYGATGVTLGPGAYFQARVSYTTTRLFRDTLRDILTAPVWAFNDGMRFWLHRNGEYALLRLYNYSLTALSRLKFGFLLAFLLVFQFLNSIIVLLLYGTGVLLLLPVMFLVWAVSKFSTIPGLPSVVNFIKAKLDSFLLGSLGDIKVYLDEPIQARSVRAKLEAAIDKFHEEDRDIYIIAHSLGSAIAYETLVIEENRARVQRVKSLITVGSILPMIWRMKSRRPSFDLPLPENLRWVNLWARYDPADAGPIKSERIKVAMPSFDPSPPLKIEKGRRWLMPFADQGHPGFKEIIVSNEDDFSTDHSGYWDNHHEVIPELVRQIWGEGSSEATANYEYYEGLRSFRRKLRIAVLSGPRLLSWCALPVVCLLSLARMNENPGVFPFDGGDGERTAQLVANLDILNLSQ